jgi:tripartite-type tricarboxylate transporter receptor subunit TctC
MGALVCGCALPVRAEDQYPDRTIRLVVPFPPGGQTDNVSRALGTALTPILGHQIVVDNRAGAAGTIGSTEVARAKPDGYTLLMGTSSTHAIYPTMQVKPAYDAVRDFEPVIATSTGPMTISVHPSVPARSLKQLVADVKAHPGQYFYGTAGVGSITHLGAELFKLRAGKLQIVHVPYKGAGPALADLVGGQIAMTCTSLSGALPHHRSGRVRTLAVLKEERSVGAPDIPTAAEAGVPGTIAYTYNVIFAPAGTPHPVVETLSGATRKVLADRSFVDTLIRLGVDPITNSDPQKAAAMVKSELERWRPLIQSLGLKS